MNSITKRSIWIIGILIVALAVHLLPTAWTVLDTTSSHLITLSEETRTLLEGLDQDVEIRFVAEQGEENRTVSALLDRYENASSHITVHQIQGTQEENETGTLVIAVGDDEQTLNAAYQYEYDYSDYETTHTAEYQYLLEKAISSAIYCMTSSEVPVFYAVNNHNELSLEDSMENCIQQNGIRIVDLDLSAGEIPEDAAGLLIASPAVDFTEEEIQCLEEYLEQGGYLLLLTDVSGAETPNFDALMASYGTAKQNGMVIEGNTSNIANAEYPYYLLPNMQDNEKMDALTDSAFPVMMLMAHGIELTGKQDDSTSITSLLQSSQDAYMKMGVEITSLTQTAEDPTGPFELAVSIENSQTGARIDWFGSSSMLASSCNQMVNNSDIRLLANAMKDACDAPDMPFEGKRVTEHTLDMDDAAVSKWSLLLLGLPLLLLVVGLAKKARR